MEVTSTTPLGQVREQLRAEWDKGVECPACNQLVKRYRRPMHAMMGASIISLYRASRTDDEYHHISEFAAGYRGLGDFAKLRYWGLVDEQPKDQSNSAKRTSGFWRITEMGREFVCDRMSVASHILLSNGHFYGFDGGQIGIRDVLRRKFDYGELMGASFTGTTK